MATNDDRERMYDRPKRQLIADLLAFGDDAQDARDVEPLLIIKTVYKGDVGGTGFFPLRETARRFGALLSFFGVRR